MIIISNTETDRSLLSKRSYIILAVFNVVTLPRTSMRYAPKKRMQYSNAATFRATAPCTNVPLHCSIRPLGPTGQPPTFWKYCFMQHMVMHHTDENLESPPIPFDLLKKVHISLAEGVAMGVSSESMMEFRKDYDIPNSDAFETEPMGHEATQNASGKVWKEEPEDGIGSVKIFKF